MIGIKTAWNQVNEKIRVKAHAEGKAEGRAAVRAASLDIEAMPWCQHQDKWRYFLDETRYPVGATLELTPDRVNIFQSITRQLRDQIDDLVRTLAVVDDYAAGSRLAPE